MSRITSAPISLHASSSQRVVRHDEPTGRAGAATGAAIGAVALGGIAALGTWLVFGGKASGNIASAIAGLTGGLFGAGIGAHIASGGHASGGSASPRDTTSPESASTPTRTVTGVDGRSAEKTLPVTARSIATGLLQPVQVASTPSDPDAIYIVEQGGVIKRHTESGTTVFADLQDAVNAGGERGLLSVAFHPDYAQNGRLFVYYNDANGDVNIGELHADNGRVSSRSLTPLLTVPHRDAGNHNGGQLNFGADGYLYAGTGDGGGAGDRNGNAQNPQQLLGKMLRIDVDRTATGKRYAIPADNPFADGTGGAPEIFALGVRNPWRWSFDRATGDMWIGDVGQSSWEEVNLLPAGTGAGANLGWNAREGSGAFRGGAAWGPGRRVNPVLQYGHDEGSSITGGFVYRGTAIPELRGWYVYADIAKSELRALKYEHGEVVGRQRIPIDAGMITGFGEDTKGELYFTDFSGAVQRLEHT